MAPGTQAAELLGRLNSFSAAQEWCNQVYCSTCGGKILAFRKALSPDLRAEITNALNGISFSELREFGEWLDALSEVVPRAVEGVFLREARAVSLEDTRAIDRFLLDARRFRSVQSELGFAYQSLLSSAIRVAIASRDSSLVETLVLVLGKDILEHGELLSLALSMKSEPNMRRALYNSLREYLPEVRDFPAE